MLSMHAEDTLVRQALEAGALGYILKNALDLEMVSAVKQVAAGKQVLDQRLGSLEPPPGQPPVLFADRINPAHSGLWSLTDIDVPEGFRAALAVQGQPPTIIHFQPA